jgi:hypothetical protein
VIRPVVLVTTAAIATSTVSDSTVWGDSVPATNNVGVLRITWSQPIPRDLSGVRYLLLDAARASYVADLKRRYPGLRVLAYKDIGFLIDYSRGPGGNAGVPWQQARERWFLHDRSGRRVNSVRYPKAWFADVGRQSYQRAWLRNVLRFLHGAPWDGVFMDDALADPGWHLGGAYRRLSRYPTRDAYRAAARSFLAKIGPALKKEGFLGIANIGASYDQPQVWGDWAGLLSGVMEEHFLKLGEGAEPVATGADWTADVNAERAVEGAGRIFLALTYGTANDAADQRYVRASFLLFDRPDTGSASIWSPNITPSSSFAVGQPVGPARRVGAVWTRAFSGGVISVDSSDGTYRPR